MSFVVNLLWIALGFTFIVFATPSRELVVIWQCLLEFER